MSYPDNGFARAQADYERQLPPESENVQCEKCEGSGKLDQSYCCGDSILENDQNLSICKGCQKETWQAECPECDGTGEVRRRV